jgi:transmembrane sensor
MPTTCWVIEKQAAEWVAKRELGNMSPEDEAAFASWLAADMRALGAYCRLEGTLVRLERAGGSATDTVPPGDAAYVPRESVAASPIPRRHVLMGGIAASVAVLCAAGGGMWLYRGRNSNYASERGLVREVPLADGSVVTLNTDSEISVRYTDTIREIRLLRGEALFDVAKNKKRPFVVFAGRAQVKAVGTSFSVSMLPRHPVQLLVKEGVVELRQATNDHGSAVRVKANTRVLIPGDNRYIAVDVAQTTVARDLAWQRGLLSFDNMTLREAADEYARYSDIRIVVDDSSAKRTVTGSFAANDPIGFAKLTAKALDLQIVVSERQVRLSGQTEKKI